MAAMTYGAQVLCDRAFLDRPLEVTLAGLAMEMETIRREFRALTQPLVDWRREAPRHLGAGMDRLLLAAIQARQEFAYYEATPILAVICQHLERLNNAVPPSTLLSVQIAPTGGSDGAPITRMSTSQAMEMEAVRRIGARALMDSIENGT